MSWAQYDNLHKCPECSGVNEYKVTEWIDYIIGECETNCEDCGHQDYWAYGFYQFNKGGEQ